MSFRSREVGSLYVRLNLNKVYYLKVHLKSIKVNIPKVDLSRLSVVVGCMGGGFYVLESDSQ